MNFCQMHWDALRVAVEKRGLSDLVAPDGRAAAEHMAAQIEQRDTLANYDPLMAAMFAITNNVYGLHPQMAMQLLSTGGCPLCQANEGHKLACVDPACIFTYDDWIDRAADEQLERVKAMRAGA